MVSAIHLEIATGLSTDACILCFFSIFQHQRCAKKIRSNNGTKFIELDKEFKNVSDLLNVDVSERDCLVLE